MTTLLLRRAAVTAAFALLVSAAPSSQPVPRVGLRLLVGPDHLFEEVRALVDEGVATIDLRVQGMDNADFVDALVARQRAGIRVRILLEHGFTWQPSNAERWAAQQIEQAGGTVFVRQPAESLGDNDQGEHARFIIIDGTKALVGTEDPTVRGMPSDSKSDGTTGRRGIYALLLDPSIVGQLSATFSEALRPTASHRVVRWTLPSPSSDRPARPADGNAYRVLRRAPLHLTGPVPIVLAGCLEGCASEREAFLNLVGRAGPGDTVVVEQFREAPLSSRRLETYLAAARRGAAVRILLDRHDDNPADPRGNQAAALRLNAAAAEEGLNLEVRLANPTEDGIHSGMVLVTLGGTRYVHLGSPDGGAETAGADARAIAIQMRSDAAYFFLEEIFRADWATVEPAPDGSRDDVRQATPSLSHVVTIRAERAAAPPPGSPLVRAEHPRIFVTRDELPGLRDRLAAHYFSELQEFIDLLAGPSLSSAQRRVETPWGAFNYALLAVLDPAELRGRGFRFNGAIDSSQKLCARSWTYAARLLPDIAAGEGQSHSAFATDLADPLYLPVIAAYDWCAPHWGQSERRQVVDAFVTNWAGRWQGQDPLTAHGVNGMVANNIASADLHDALGILAFYGDSYPDSSTQAALYETFERVWLERVLVELQYFYSQGTGWHEGSGGYLKEGHLNLGLPFALISSALGSNYFVDVPFFAQYPAFVAANIKPHGQSSANGRRYLERWGVISDGISGIGCRGLQLTGGMLAKAGDARAGVARWLHLGEWEERSCDEEMRRRGEGWVNAGLYWFLFGDRHVPPTPPEGIVPTSLRLGLGEYVFRSDWSPAATQVIAWANQWDMYGHEPRTDGGQFTLHKFGNLILHAGNGKSGEGVVENFMGTNLSRNTIGIRRGNEAVLQFAPAKTFDEFWIARGLDRIELRGAVIADQVGGSLDYMAFDASLMWTASGDNVERELAYLRGPTNQEYVVVLDRVRLANEADAPVWKVWTAAETDFWAGNQAGNQPPGVREASGRPIARVVNVRGGLKTDHFESPDTHGTLFVTPVWPDRVRMRILGGPGREFQDLNGGTPFGTPEMTDGSREYLGWGRVETWPQERGSHHVFLHVLQPGDAHTLSTPTPAARVASADGAWIGATVDDPNNPWVVMWLKDRSQPPALPLRYREPSLPGARHAIFNLTPNTPVRIERTGGEVIVGGPSGSEAMVSPSGVLVVGP